MAFILTSFLTGSLIADPHAKNILQDDSVKYPGMTHAAFVVDDIEALMAQLKHENIPITDGPHIYGNRRKLIFIRDPDGNVLEFNEILK